MNTEHFDVIIAGAGPAACAAAIRLRQFNLRVCLVDDVKKGALKVGESIPGAMIRLLRRIEVNSLADLLPSADFSNCVANVSAWGTDEWVYQDALRNPEGGGWHVIRHKFDEALHVKAIEKGVEFFPAKVGELTLLENGFHRVYFKNKEADLPEFLTTKWIIDATGRSAAVLKKLKVNRTTFETQLAAIAWLSPNKNDYDQTTRIKSVENGWWYSSLLPDKIRVISFHGLAENVTTFVKSSDHFIQAANESRIVPYPIQVDSILEGVQARKADVAKAAQWHGDSWLAIGDAALSFDPLSSQGIFFAFYSGVRAAETIAETFQSPENKTLALQKFSNELENVFHANQRSRRYYYSIEQRFRESDYWKSRLNPEESINNA